MMILDQEKAMGEDKLWHNGRCTSNHEFHGRGGLLASNFSSSYSNTAPFKKVATLTTLSLIISIVLFIEAFFSARWRNIDVSDLTRGESFRKSWSYNSSAKLIPKKRIEYSLNCSTEGNMEQSCPVSAGPNSTTIFEPGSTEPEPSTETCPEYFQWIYEDLRPWREMGITRELVEDSRPGAYIRIIVVDGKLYMEKYKGVFQTRDVFTIWGILQLLRLYPGQLPDFDLMFSCGDKTAMRKRYFQGPNATAPQPLFHYCGDDETYDIVFPDWSFWGWPEIRIKPWNALKEDLKEGNNRARWIDREPYAYWRGNINLGRARRELSKCIQTDQQDWNARIYDLDWRQENQNGFNSTDLASQCTHRYKIYAEGISWSVSEKYILACDSVTLLANPQHYDFFTRSLQPLVHYWPLKLDDMCESIKFATDWCNNHTEKAQQIGKAGSSFVQENLKMKYVYDYMFHLLSMYAKLLKYKPTVPPGAVEFCPETMACPVKGLRKDYEIESMVTTSSETGPCTIPTPYDPAELHGLLEKKEHVMKQVEEWEASGNVGEEMFENLLQAN